VIILIGGSSFIGVYTAAAFAEAGNEVVATGRTDKVKPFYDSLGISYIKLDLEQAGDFDRLPTSNVEGVVLLAGLLPANATVDLIDQENADEYIKVNTLGTYNALEYCRKNHISKLISTTSYAEVSGAFGRGDCITEEEPISFLPYGDHAAYIISKLAARRLMDYYNHQHGLSSATFRLPPVYGVGPHGGLFENGRYRKSGLQIFIDKAMTGEEISVFGDKNAGRDVVYVKDVADAFVRIMSAEQAKGLYNITSGRIVTLEEQARVIADVFSEADRKSKIVYQPEKDNGIKTYLFDISKAVTDFNYMPGFADFQTMMEDYKAESDRGYFSRLFD
jgi:UDP-glucose 4-epimerase